MEFIGKSLFIESEKILVLGDMHFGMEGDMKSVNFDVELRDDFLNDLKLIFKNVGEVDRVVLLGDLKHSFSGISKGEWRDIMRVFDYIKDNCNKLTIVKGNHDNFLMNIVYKWKKENDYNKIDLVDYYIRGCYAFLHGDKDFEEIKGKEINYWIMGHAHPAIVLREKEGIKSEKYKCFLVGKYKTKGIIIVPSFVEFSEGSDPRDIKYKLAWNFDLSKFNVKVVGENLRVVDFGKLKDLE